MDDSFHPVVSDGDAPPVYKIDLSLPPAQRYVALAEIYRDKMRSLTGLFDELVGSIHPNINVAWVNRIARLLLRRLYTHEETEEIRGVSRVTGIDLYLLVSLNVVLDILMGCTSGGARCKNAHDAYSKMLHFRTLDWTMDWLRDLVVQLDFVRSPHTEQVIATSITYVGFVGVLTGVRKNLSVSLNFRPNHDTNKRFANFRFYGSHLLVLLDIRRSVSSLLRQCLLPPVKSRGNFFTRRWAQTRRQIHTLSLSALAAMLPQIPTTSAYLTLSDGNTTTVLEKDHRSALTRSSSSFIVATNSDIGVESSESVTKTESTTLIKAHGSELTDLEDLIEDSLERRACMQAFWDQKTKRTERKNRDRTATRQPRPPTADRQGRLRQAPLSRTDIIRHRAQLLEPSSTASQNTTVSPLESDRNTYTLQDQEVTATTSEIIEWTCTYPITNEMTHLAAVMDATEGKVVWVRRYHHPFVFDEG
ncbi:hypothetical protein AJ79_09734 [Helicocarpus griseus UAMH5409]|uniref:ceramidase n=1 Tax=Helicocarpus griseus UAMH5409 TaxID=1447875 RepID=A0A2B7WHJ6_9EURO|nr:hypothetical protein AJ79_09734 [Helicocarpus griseus UAMH5409]